MKKYKENYTLGDLLYNFSLSSYPIQGIEYINFKADLKIQN